MVYYKVWWYYIKSGGTLWYATRLMKYHQTKESPTRLYKVPPVFIKYHQTPWSFIKCFIKSGCTLLSLEAPYKVWWHFIIIVWWHVLKSSGIL
jgi:hypothetical protein